MINKLLSARKLTVRGDRAVQMVKDNPNRVVLNISAGDVDVWVGQDDVTATTEQNKIPAGTRMYLNNIQGELWIIGVAGTTSKVSFSEEVQVSRG